MQYAHKDLAPSIRDEFDPDRPSAGMVVIVDDPSEVEQLIAHNERLASSNQLYPSIVKTLIGHECLAGNRFTLVQANKGGQEITIDGPALGRAHGGGLVARMGGART